jgi:hypothetical protein
MRWLLLLTLLIACGDPFAAPVSAVRFEPPAIYSSYWQQMASCLDRDADFRRVTWYSVPDSGLRYAGEPAYGVWNEPHAIYIEESFLDNPYVVKHEMIHDLLQTGKHSPIFFTCDPAI